MAWQPFSNAASSSGNFLDAFDNKSIKDEHRDAPNNEVTSAMLPIPLLIYM